MSFGIFLVACLSIVAILFVQKVVYDELHPTKWMKVFNVVFAFVSSSVVLGLFICAFTFKNFTHMFAAMKYDHVVCLEWEKLRSKPEVEIDPKKVLYQNEWHTVEYRAYELVIMGWNDDEKNKMDRYEQVVDK